MPTLIRVLALVVYAVVRMVGALFELLCMVPFLLLALGLGFVAMYLLATFFVSPAHAMTVVSCFWLFSSSSCSSTCGLRSISRMSRESRICLFIAHMGVL